MNMTDVIRRPLITEKTSILREDGKTIVFHVAAGATKIDIKRAEAARQRAEERLSEYSGVSVDRERAREALAKAIARLETARHAKG